MSDLPGGKNGIAIRLAIASPTNIPACSSMPRARQNASQRQALRFTRREAARTVLGTAEVAAQLGLTLENMATPVVIGSGGIAKANIIVHVGASSGEHILLIAQRSTAKTTGPRTAT